VACSRVNFIFTLSRTTLKFRWAVFIFCLIVKTIPFRLMTQLSCQMTGFSEQIGSVERLARNNWNCSVACVHRKEAVGLCPWIRIERLPVDCAWWQKSKMPLSGDWVHARRREGSRDGSVDWLPTGCVLTDSNQNGSFWQLGLRSAKRQELRWLCLATCRWMYWGTRTNVADSSGWLLGLH